MLREVVDEHVPTPASQTGLADSFGGELVGQSLVESHERVETLEHFPVARGVRSSARDDVAAVFAVLTDCLDELPAFGQCFTECCA